MIVCAIIAVSLASLAYVWLFALTAPIGYEDEDGFHFKKDDENE